MSADPVGMVRSQERPARAFNGYLMLLVLLAAIALGVWLVSGGLPPDGATKAMKIAFVGKLVSAFVIALIVSIGFYMIQPNQAAVLSLFGAYSGTDRTEGLRWVWPWMGKRKVSVRANNLISERIKVNDLRGNPIEMAAQVVWRVIDTAQALYDVDDYKSFVMVQIEAAVRTIGAR